MMERDTPASGLPSLPPGDLRISERVVFRNVGCEAVLLDLRSGRYFGLDPVGTRIWSLLAEQRRSSEILSALDNEYDAPKAVLAADLAVFLDRLWKCGLLKTDA